MATALRDRVSRSNFQIQIFKIGTPKDRRHESVAASAVRKKADLKIKMSVFRPNYYALVTLDCFFVVSQVKNQKYHSDGV